MCEKMFTFTYLKKYKLNYNERTSASNEDSISETGFTLPP